MRKITGIITNGKQKGKEKTISYDESYSSVVTDKYKVNDKIILDASDIELKRDFYLTLMIVIFLNLLYIVSLDLCQVFRHIFSNNLILRYK